MKGMAAPCCKAVWWDFCLAGGLVVHVCGYFFWFLIFVFSVLAKRLAEKSICKMTYFVASEM